MDLIFTNAERADQGVLSAYGFDLSFGESENDFVITLGAREQRLVFGGFIYIEGTEYGGTVDAAKKSTNAESMSYMGRTWHGILNSKVIEPDAGEAYFIVSGDANEVLSTLIDRLGLSGLFSAAESLSGISISKYQFRRYCKGYDGIRAMLAANGAKLKIEWKDRSVCLSAEPIVDYTESPVDGDMATLTVEHHEKKVNHLICLGKGELTEREVIHLYVDKSGKIGDVQYFTGLDDMSEIYDNSNTEDLRKDGIAKLKELLDIDKADLALNENEETVYDIGDIVGAMDVQSGISVATAVSQKIVRIINGAISTEYKTGSDQ
jgi:hypothetical protein